MLLRCRCCRYDFTPAIAPSVAPVVAPLSLLLSLRCHSDVAPLLLSCRSTAASVALLPLLLLLMLLRCHYCYRYCCHSTVTPDFALLLLRCRSAIAPLSVCCRSVVAPLPLLSLLLLLLLLLLLSRHCCCLDCSRLSPQDAESG